MFVFGFGMLRHTITAIAVTTGDAHFEEVVAVYNVPTTLDGAVA